MMGRAKSIFLALLEVLILRALILLMAIGLFISPLREWQAQHLGNIFSNQLLFILIPIGWLLITRRSLEEYGITFRNFRADLNTALSCLLFFAIAGASLGFLAYTRWNGALIAALVQLLLLALVAWTLTHRPDPGSGVLTITLAILMFGGYSAWKALFPGMGQAISNVIFYLLVGFGEETLNRGFVLTRLDQAFGRPYHLAGVYWGWGAIIGSLLFGLSHVVNGLDPLTGQFTPQWAWGFWTFFSGLVFCYLREKTSTIVAPAIVHGLPQALITFFMHV